MLDHRRTALKQNFDYFQDVVGDLMGQFAGQYALLRKEAIVGIFPQPIEALNVGHEKFDDGLFSIQKVTDSPHDLGFMSYGAGDRMPD